ncbi:ABC transporter substrate-binding protein [Rhodobacterales bacterium]|nr:ABC transporter substrate-binding protein [Rhodobacterales bacterium]
MAIIRNLSLVALSLTFGLSTPALAAPKSELVLAIGGEPDQGYDPLLDWGRYGHPLFQSTLLTRDAQMNVKPDLATQVALSDDRLTWTIALRSDAKFSDGTPVTAEDVAFTFNKAKTAGGALDLWVLKQARAIDDTTVEITLSEPWITFSEFLFTLGIVPSKSYGPDYSRHPVGSGPYEMVSWTEGEQLIVKQNPHYYGKQSPFERITFLFTGDDTSLAATHAGQVDVVSVPAPSADAPPAGFKQVVVDSVDNRGMSFPMLPDDGKTTSDGYPIGNDVTSDLAIRQAINLGVDREQIVEVALFGHGTPAYGPADGLPWSNPKAAIAHDPDAARALLDAAGWAAGSDGIRQKDDVRASFSLIYPASDSTRQAIVVTVAEQLKALGIEAIPQGKSWDVIEREMQASPVLFGWGSHNPLEVYSLYQSSWAGQALYNPGYFSDPDVDAHFAAAQAAESLEASYPHWQAAEWDGESGFSAKGKAGWAWLVNLDHIYYVNECIDLGATQIEPHGHGWPITSMIQNWKWDCE